jgi:hypothetical protein
MMEQSGSGSNTRLRVAIRTDVVRQAMPRFDRLKSTT